MTKVQGVKAYGYIVMASGKTVDLDGTDEALNEVVDAMRTGDTVVRISTDPEQNNEDAVYEDVNVCVARGTDYEEIYDSVWQVQEWLIELLEGHM